MGFATLETMGYGFSALLQSRSIADLDQTLLLRGLLSPAGHVAWTGITTAALWQIPSVTRKGRAVLVFVTAFVASVVLHALWDGSSSVIVRALVGIVSSVRCCSSCTGRGITRSAAVPAPVASTASGPQSPAPSGTHRPHPGTVHALSTVQPCSRLTTILQGPSALPAVRPIAVATVARVTGRPEVLAIGETMVLVAPADADSLESAVDFRLDPGGAEANVASHLAALGHHAAWVGAVGDDALGRRLCAQLAARGVDVSYVPVDADGPDRAVREGSRCRGSLLPPWIGRLSDGRDGPGPDPVAAGCSAGAPDRHHARAVGGLPRSRGRDLRPSRHLRHAGQLRRQPPSDAVVARCRPEPAASAGRSGARGVRRSGRSRDAVGGHDSRGGTRAAARTRVRGDQGRCRSGPPRSASTAAGTSRRRP